MHNSQSYNSQGNRNHKVRNLSMAESFTEEWCKYANDELPFGRKPEVADQWLEWLYRNEARYS